MAPSPGKNPAIGPVLITGCSSGVRHAAARLFRAAGYETFATARDVTTLDALRALGCRTLALDVTREDQRRAAVDAVELEFGAVGVLVNNAGYGQYGPIEEIPLDAVRLQFETNVFGGLRLSARSPPLGLLHGLHTHSGLRLHCVKRPRAQMMRSRERHLK